MPLVSITSNGSSVMAKRRALKLRKKAGSELDVVCRDVTPLRLVWLTLHVEGHYPSVVASNGAPIASMVPTAITA